jgi:DNA-binding Lrp family transcriptional regulator
VLLLLMADTMTDRGLVSVPQERLADQLGVEPRRVKARIAEAKAARLIDRVGGGYSGRTAEYIAIIPARLGTAQRTPISGKGAGLRHPLNGPLSPHDPAVMGTAGRTPNTRASLSERRKRNDGERFACVERADVQPQGRSEERAPLNIRLAALSPWAALAYAPITARLEAAA